MQSFPFSLTQNSNSYNSKKFVFIRINHKLNASFMIRSTSSVMDLPNSSTVSVN